MTGTNDRDKMPGPSLEEVVDKVYAFVQPDGSWGLNNAGILLGERGLTLVDTAFTESRARFLRQTAERLSAHPVRTLVNTHHHGDHTYGNFLFPEATVIGHRLCREAVLATGLETQKYFPGVDWGEIEIVAPSVTFDDRLTLHVDVMRLDLISMAPAHTTNDIVVWLPEHRLLFAGDLVFNGGTPFVVMGSVAGLLDALERLRNLGAEVIVPGHGSVCGPDAIDDQIEYLRFVQELARSGSDAGLLPLDVARQADLGRFAEWTDSERIVGNLHRAYSEIAGEPLGVRLPFDTIVDDMVAYRGGPLHCVA
jgi:cyclase